jgi:O-antigen ligase
MAWVGLCILENNSEIFKAWNSLSQYKFLFILFILYYLWQVFSLLYTKDLKLGMLNLFSRLSLILFPFVLIFPGEIIKSKAKLLIRLFAFGTFLYLVFCFGYALYRSLNINEGLLTFNPRPPDYFWLSYFYGADLTISQHPAYTSMYVLLSVFICLEEWFDNTKKILNRLCWLTLGTLLLISQYFISSRAGILSSIVLLPIYFIFKLRNFGKRKFAWIWILLIIIALIPVLLKNQRVDYLFGELFNKQVGYERKKDPRFLIWKSSLNVAKKNLFLGVGIGDVKSELALEYDRIGEEQMAKERLNAHNQFLEVLLENGIIGLILFVSIFVCMIYIAISDKNILYGFFIMIVFIFFLFETMLYRLAGVTFFSMFSFLLLVPDMGKKEESPVNQLIAE